MKNLRLYLPFLATREQRADNRLRYRAARAERRQRREHSYEPQSPPPQSARERQKGQRQYERQEDPNGLMRIAFDEHDDPYEVEGKPDQIKKSFMLRRSRSCGSLTMPDPQQHYLGRKSRKEGKGVPRDDLQDNPRIEVTEPPRRDNDVTSLRSQTSSIRRTLPRNHAGDALRGIPEEGSLKNVAISPTRSAHNDDGASLRSQPASFRSTLPRTIGGDTLDRIPEAILARGGSIEGKSTYQIYEGNAIARGIVDGLSKEERRNAAWALLERYHHDALEAEGGKDAVMQRSKEREASLRSRRSYASTNRRAYPSGRRRSHSLPRPRLGDYLGPSYGGPRARWGPTSCASSPGFTMFI